MRALKRTGWGKLSAWFGAHHTWTILIGATGIIASAALITAAMLYQSPVHAPTGLFSKPKPTPAPVYYSPLTGDKVPDETSTKQVVTAIMIENSPDARPQSGLYDAGVVFEAIAEGGITRFLALYQEDKPQLIGPVRSLRLYYVDWLAPFQPSVAHIGGSKFALQEIRNGEYRDIDEFFNSKTYWRAKDRYAPHNVYTSFERLDELNQKKGYSTSEFTAWPRTDGKPAKVTTAGTIDVKISGPLYNNRYVYDKASNTYARYLGGAVHTDREKGGIKPSVVIVLDTKMTTVMEDGYRQNISTIGSGKAHIFQNGEVIVGTWAKADRGSQLVFADSTGKEIKLNRGQTWITAVPANQGGKVTWQATK